MKTQIELSKSQNGRKNRFPMSSPHLTTLNVGQFRPLMVYELNAGDTIDVKLSQISDSIPTAVKTYGAFMLRQFAHWCPKRLVYRNYNNFKRGTNDVALSFFIPPYFTLELFAKAFFGLTKGDQITGSDLYLWSVAESTDYATLVGESVACDFIVHVMATVGGGQPQRTTYRFKLKSRGRLLYNIFLGLGYNFGNVISTGITDSTIGSNIAEQYDLMALMSMSRFFYDYAYPSSYLDQQGFGFLFENVQYGLIDSSTFGKILDLVFVGVKSDFFTQSWIRPNQKSIGSPSTPSGTVYSQPSSISNNLAVSNSPTLNDLGVAQNVASQTYTLSATTQRWLEALNDFIIRNNIGGTRFNEWLRSHFGFVTSDESCEISSIVKMWTDVINFNGVEATTTTETQLLGQRAAVGLGSGGSEVKFDAKEDGFLIFYAMLVPDTAYYQGLAPWCERLTSQYQLYLPELDGVDMEPIPYKQIAGAPSNDSEAAACSFARWNDAFGFAPRYARRYKIPYSVLSGDFRLGSRNTGMEAYHTYRNVYFGRSSDNPFALDAQFLQADNQYDRVFAVHPNDDDDSSANDKVRSFFYFNTTKWSRMLPFGDSLPFMDDDNNNGVSVENGGTDVL